jgi:probable HAF family extracellular repeat protein
MKRTERLTLIAAVVGILVLPGQVFAARQLPATKYPYTAIDLGTLGGPSSQNGFIVNGGTVLVQADTAIHDPDYRKAGSTDRYLSHAALWRSGKLTDLGALPGNNSSSVFFVNARGDAVGLSETGRIDPLLGSPEVGAVVWKGGKIIRLPTLGGRESIAGSINNSGQVAGFTTNTVRDHLAHGLDGGGPTGTEAQAFLWTQAGGMRSLGTLGGPDSAAFSVNSRGQVAGSSFTSARVNPVTGVPPEHPFLWTPGRGMRDLGTLGGSAAFPSDNEANLNDRGEMVGQSNVRSDAAFHAFLWNGSRMLDLGTFGGPYSAANAINQAGDVVGFAQVTPGGGTCRAFLWRNGRKINLGVVSGQSSSNAVSVNARDQVVGGQCDNQDGSTPPGAWLWERGVMRDLNTLIAPSALHLTGAGYIADNGNIAAVATLRNGHQHAVLLVPARQAHGR